MLFSGWYHQTIWQSSHHRQPDAKSNSPIINKNSWARTQHTMISFSTLPEVWWPSDVPQLVFITTVPVFEVIFPERLLGVVVGVPQTDHAAPPLPLLLGPGTWGADHVVRPAVRISVPGGPQCCTLLTGQEARIFGQRRKRKSQLSFIMFDLASWGAFGSKSF